MVLKGKLLEEKYESKLQFPGDEGVQNEKLLWGEYGHFLELHISLFTQGNLTIMILDTCILNSTCTFIILFI